MASASSACVNITMAARQVDGMSGSEPRTANSGLIPRKIFSTFCRRPIGVSWMSVFSCSISFWRLRRLAR